MPGRDGIGGGIAGIPGSKGVPGIDGSPGPIGPPGETVYYRAGSSLLY